MDSRTKNRKQGAGERAGRWSKARTVLFAVVLAFSTAGCEGLLDVEVPGEITETEALSPTQAESAVIGVIALFEDAFSEFTANMASHESTYWRTSSLYGDHGEYNNPRPNAGGYYSNFQSSRALAEQLYDLLTNQWTDAQVPDRRQYAAAVATYAGLSYQYLGEVYCELAVNVGPIMTPAETLKEGEAWFTRAIEQFDEIQDFEYFGVPSMETLAHLGRARVRFALGTHYAEPSEQAGYLAGAESDALEVADDPGFVAYATRDGNQDSRWNKVYEDHTFQGYGTVAGRVPDPNGDWITAGDSIPFTGYRYLIVDDDGNAVIDGQTVLEERDLGEEPTTGVADPRVPVEIVPGDFGLEGIIQMYRQLKYTSRADDMILAKWAEAILILAEIEGGQAAVARINQVRDAHELPHFSSDDPEEIMDAIIEERRREFFFEGRHWADKLRYDLWFPRGRGVAIPERRGAYGIATCVLMPEDEYDVNPNLEGDGSEHLPSS